MEKGQTAFTKDDSMKLKGIAIIFLVVYHCFVSEKVFTEYNINCFPMTQETAIYLTKYFKACVSIFTFISGYGLYQSYSKVPQERKENREWALSHIIKLLSGLWFVYIFVIVFGQIADGLFVRKYFKEGIVRGILYVFLDMNGMAKLFESPTITGTWWYMGAAVFFILMVPILKAASQKAGWFITCSVIVFLPRVLTIGFPGSMNPYSFLTTFISGMIFSEFDIFKRLENIHLMKNRKADEIFKFIASLLILWFSCLAVLRLAWKTAWEISYTVCPVIFICFCWKYIIRIPILKNILWYLGKYSMNIFLVHSILKNRYLRTFLYSLRNYWLIPLALLIISLIISVFTEKIKKIIRYDKGISKLCVYANKLLC